MTMAASTAASAAIIGFDPASGFGTAYSVDPVTGAVTAIGNAPGQVALSAGAAPQTIPYSTLHVYQWNPSRKPELCSSCTTAVSYLNTAPQNLTGLAAVNPAPEPSTVLLAMAGVAVVYWRRRR